MKLRLKTRKVKGKERIVFEFKAGDNKLEKKVIRSLHSANFDKKAIIKYKPLIELKFISSLKEKEKRILYPGEDTKPEQEEISKLPCLVDQEEYDAAIRTSKARTLAKSLGIVIPDELAKKFHCRCGDVFIDPLKFLHHRKICKVLRSSDTLARSMIVVARAKEEEKAKIDISKKEKETFPCRCGHVFPNEKMCKRHQKLCTVINECSDLFERCKGYLEQMKHEGKPSRGKDKKERMGQWTKTKAKKRKPKRRILTKRST